MVPAFLYNLTARHMSPLGQFGFSVSGEGVYLTSLTLFDLFGFVWAPNDIFSLSSRADSCYCHSPL